MQNTNCDLKIKLINNNQKQNQKMITRRRHDSTSFGKYEQPPPNFLNDIIMPTIYNIDNIKIVSAHKSRRSPKNQVHEARKKKIQQKILQIVNKQKQTTIRQSDKVQRPHTAIIKLKKNVQTPEKKCHLMVGQQYRQSQFQLEVENHINEQGFTTFEVHKRQKKRIQQMLNKVKRLGFSVHSKQAQQNIDIYLTSISPTKNIKANQKIFIDHNKGEGHLQQLKRLEKQGQKPAINIKSIERNNTDTKGRSFPIRLASTASGTRRAFSQSNLKTIVRNQDLKAQSTILMDNITKLQQSSSSKQTIINEKFKKMQNLMNKIVDKKLEVDDNVVLGISLQTLQLLRMKRLKQISLRKLDKKMLNSSKNSDNNLSN